MTLMYDSVNPFDIPVDAPAVAGYADGMYVWTTAGWDRFPNRPRLLITVTGVDADVLDVETGDATPADAVDWVRTQRQLGFPYPGVYCSSSLWPTVKATFAAHNVDPPWYWIADYDGKPDIPVGALAKQYLNAPGSGGHYDLSVISPALVTLINSGGMRMISQDDANLIASTILNWSITTPTHGPGVGRQVWDVLGDGERLATALAAEESQLAAAIAAVPAAGAVDVHTLATALAGPLAAALAPTLPPETTPAELFTALAAQLSK
jgi:hypothetical protein